MRAAFLPRQAGAANSDPGEERQLERGAHDKEPEPRDLRLVVPLRGIIASEHEQRDEDGNDCEDRPTCGQHAGGNRERDRDQEQRPE
jgi:hypothetical protein